MGDKTKAVVSDELINVTTNSSRKPYVPSAPSADDYKIVLEEDGYYKITLEGETIIHTKVSAKLIEDFTLMGILPENATEAEQQKAIQAYLIRAAKEFVSKQLHIKKQDGRGKIDIPGIEDEF
ncbi:MAG: hypothetical protein WC979_00155 [Candidatus Pacearchaeota archaeon]|jgi:hypothetical protein|nr:hypothetical protein [Clostridia bacterium]